MTTAIIFPVPSAPLPNAAPLADPRQTDPRLADPRQTDPRLADPRLAAVATRDARWDGAFVFAVTSTRIFCRPSCPSRRPRPDRVRLYDDAESARTAGYRACKRCHPERTAAQDATAAAIGRALRHLEHEPEPATLDALAIVAGLSRAHFQREFTRLVGCSPLEWRTSRRAERMRASLVAGEGVSSAAFGAGFDSLPSAYVAAERHLGVTPGSLRRGAAGETVFFTIVPCALGHALVAMTQRGVCRVILGDDAAILETQLRAELHAATLVADDRAVRETATAVVAAASGAASTAELPLDLRGTAFQQRVWRELTRVPRGETITYAELARRVGAPGAVRAVGSACGANPAALVIPCHRVVRSDGALGGYRWGLERKQQLLEAEQADN